MALKKKLTKTELAQLLKIHLNAFNYLEENNVLVPGKDGLFDLEKNLKQYFESLDYQKRQYAGIKNTLLTTKIEKEQTYIDKLKVRLVDKDEVYKEILEEVIPVFNSIKATLGALAGKLSLCYDNQRQVHLVVHNELNNIFQLLDIELENILQSKKEATPEEYRIKL